MIPYSALTSVLTLVILLSGLAYGSLYDTPGIPIVLPDDGVPTCDPAGYYSKYPYSGYRISMEVRVPHSDTQLLSDLTYNTLVNSDYEKFFVLSVCDMNFVTGELGIPVENREDVWNKTICSDILPLGMENEGSSEQKLWEDEADADERVNAAITWNRKKLSAGVGGRLNDQTKLEAKNHPYFDMFLNYRLQMFNRDEPDVRPQYCFRTARATMFLKNEESELFKSKLTPEWDKHMKVSNFVGGLYDCYENNITQYDSTTGDIICSEGNTRPVLPLYRDSWPFMWASIIVSDDVTGEAQDEVDTEEELEEDKFMWAVRIPWLYTPDIYDQGAPKVESGFKMVLQPERQAFKRISLRSLNHDAWTKKVHKFEL